MTDPTASPFSAAAGFPDQVIAPATLSVVWTTTATTATATWTPIAGALYYDVYLSISPRTPRRVKQQATGVSYVVAGLLASSRYYGQVVAFFSPEKSVASAQTQITTQILANSLLSYTGDKLLSFTGNVLFSG